VTTTAETGHRRLAYATSTYGALSIALVVVTWEADGNEWHLVEVIAGYVITMWLTHTYAGLVSRGDFTSWLDVVREESPVAVAGLPALAVALAGQVFGWPQEEVADLCLVACAVTLVLIQTRIVSESGFSRRRLTFTVVVDMVLAAVIIALHVLI
jgi:hypothetical protein